jgi:hypothetical protein
VSDARAILRAARALPGLSALKASGVRAGAAPRAPPAMLRPRGKVSGMGGIPGFDPRSTPDLPIFRLGRGGGYAERIETGKRASQVLNTPTTRAEPQGAGGSGCGGADMARQSGHHAPRYVPPVPLTQCRTPQLV